MSEHWSRYEKLVLDKLESHTAQLAKIEGELSAARVDIEGLKVRSSIWGGLAGFVAAFLIKTMKFGE